MNKKKLIIPFILLIVLLIPFGMSYFSFQSQQISNQGEKEFTTRLEKAISQGSAFKLSEITPFDWDRVYVFKPYTTKSDMEKITAVSWNTRHTYVGYLLDRTFLGEYPLDDDSLNKLVFMKDGKVVLDVTFNRATADFTGMKETWYDKDIWLGSEEGNHVVIFRP
ncbi:hypothetical protein MUG84_03940 [Paenibacillus sp. KQZ6P-2]|uniref:Uncharacterized protein n=1 Tax=Paenibacillus mangrovi TaxID=2931978 RepID=A0A9X1WLJ9_9BACL|nr:hypothetical protein [Paenibacillus mangrovi]MCJ8010896.1 hypothetical protein [Paenibacillus mangrovi]